MGNGKIWPGGLWEGLVIGVALSEGLETDLASPRIRKRDCWNCPTRDCSWKRIRQFTLPDLEECHNGTFRMQAGSCENIRGWAIPISQRRNIVRNMREGRVSPQHLLVQEGSCSHKVLNRVGHYFISLIERGF